MYRNINQFFLQLSNLCSYCAINREVIPVSADTSFATAQALAQKEGIFCGISCGATFAAALDVAQRAEPGSVILCTLPDTGERYLSTPLFGDIEAEMTEEEWALARSTPSAVLAA